MYTPKNDIAALMSISRARRWPGSMSRSRLLTTLSECGKNALADGLMGDAFPNNRGCGAVFEHTYWVVV
jgi:hypothetical protein